MKMKKRYTKKQIMESIAYWKKQLKRMNESSDFDVIHKLGPITATTQPEDAAAIIIVIPKIGLNYANIKIYPVDQNSLEYFLTSTADMNPKSNISTAWSVFEEDYPDCIFTTETNKEIVKIIPMANNLYTGYGQQNKSKSLSISQQRVGEIGEEIEQNVRKAFDRAEERGRSIIPGDPIVDEDNRDDLEEDVLDKLFGGGNNPSKNDIGAENAWNLY